MSLCHKLCLTEEPACIVFGLTRNKNKTEQTIVGELCEKMREQLNGDEL